MKRRPRAEMYIREREAGLTCVEIAKKYGVSHQTVYQATGKYNPDYFRPMTAQPGVYPNLLKWMNENRVNRTELLRRMGKLGVPAELDILRRWLNGKTHPRKRDIDRMLRATGLTYEQMFAEE